MKVELLTDGIKTRLWWRSIGHIAVVLSLLFVWYRTALVGGNGWFHFLWVLIILFGLQALLLGVIALKGSNWMSLVLDKNGLRGVTSWNQPFAWRVEDIIKTTFEMDGEGVAWRIHKQGKSGLSRWGVKNKPQVIVHKYILSWDEGERVRHFIKRNWKNIDGQWMDIDL